MLQAFYLRSTRGSTDTRLSTQRGLHALHILPSKQAFPDVRHAGIIVDDTRRVVRRAARFTVPLLRAPAVTILARLVSQEQHGQRDAVHFVPIGAGEQHLACLGTISRIASFPATAAVRCLLFLFLLLLRLRNHRSGSSGGGGHALVKSHRRAQLFLRQLHQPIRARTTWQDEPEVLHAVHDALVHRRERLGVIRHVCGDRVALRQDGDAVGEIVAGPLTPSRRVTRCRGPYHRRRKLVLGRSREGEAHVLAVACAYRRECLLVVAVYVEQGQRLFRALGGFGTQGQLAGWRLQDGPQAILDALAQTEWIER